MSDAMVHLIHPSKTLQGHTDRVWCVDVNSGVVVTGGGDRNVKLWDITTGQCTYTLVAADCAAVVATHIAPPSVWYAAGMQAISFNWATSSSVPATVPTSSQPLLLCMAVHPPLIYAGYGDAVIRVWKNGVCKGRYQGHAGEIRCIRIVGHAMYSGSEDQSIIRWNTNTAKPSTLFKGTNGPIRDLLVNGDDLYLANGSTVRVQKISSGDLKFNLIGHTEVVVTIVLDAVSGILYSGAADCRVGLWRSGALLGFFQPAAPDIVKALRLHNGMLYAAIASEVLVWDVASVTRTVGVQIARPNSPPALHDAFGFAGGDDFNSADSGGSASNFGNFGFIGAQSNEAFSDPSLMALTMSFPAPPVERAASVVSPTLARRGPQPASVISPTLARRATPQQQQAAVASPRPQHRNNPLPALPPVPRPQPPAPSAAMPPTGHDRALPALPPDDDDNDAPAPAVDVSASLSPRVPRPLPRGAPGDAAAMEQRSPPLSPEFTSPVGSPRIEQARPLPAVATFSPNTLRRPLPTQQPPPQQSHASMSPPPLERPAQRSPAAAAAAAAQPNAPPPLPRPAAHRVAQQQRSLRQQQQQQTSELWDL